ncbi:MAG: hypothetical protein AB8C84_10260 [Oligoflexales bacterium]
MSAVSNNCYVETVKGKKPAVRCVFFDEKLVVVTMCDGEVCKVAKDKVRPARFTCPRSQKKQVIHGVFRLETAEAFLLTEEETKYTMKQTAKKNIYALEGASQEWLFDTGGLEAYRADDPQVRLSVKSLEKIRFCP